MKEKMKSKNPMAVALGRLAAGKPKHYSAAELARRRARMREFNRQRALRTKMNQK